MRKWDVIQCDPVRCECDSRCRSCAWKSPPKPHSTTKWYGYCLPIFQSEKDQKKKNTKKDPVFHGVLDSHGIPWQGSKWRLATRSLLHPDSNGPQGVVPLPLEPQKGARKSWENWRCSRFLRKSQRTSGIFFLGFSHVFTFKSAVSCNTVPIKTGISSHALMMLNCNRGSLGVVTWNRISNGWGLSGRVATQKT